MRDLLDHDEAYNGLDALSLLETPRLTPFFESNNGRESLWMYLLAPSVAIFGAQPFALRLVAVFTGVLTLDAVHALARELLGKRAALWTLAALAVLYWHVHLSHVAFRALLYPFIGSLAFALLLRAHRLNRGWLMAGVMTGALLYTYFSARLWVGLAGLLLLVWLIREPRLRRGSLRALIAAGVVALPLLIYTLQNPHIALGRVGDQAVVSPTLVLENTRLWLGAWLAQGSTYAFHNPMGRPILDLPLAILLVVGIAVLVARKRSAGLLILLLAVLAIIPSVFSVDAPHFLRAIGLVVPIALVLGAAIALSKKPQWVMVALLILVWTAFNTYRDFNTWVVDYRPPGGNGYKLAHSNALLTKLDHQFPLYTYQTTVTDPLPRFLLQDYHLQPLPLFNFPNCTVGPDGTFRYLAPLDYEPHPADPVTQWSQPELLLHDESGLPAELGYSLYFAESHEIIQPLVLDQRLQIALSSEIETTNRAGDTLTLPLRFSALADLDQPYTVYVHVLREGQLITQLDTLICTDYPTSEWRMGQAAMQSYPLTLPADLTAGDYVLNIGVYNSTTLEPLGAESLTIALRVVP